MPESYITIEPWSTTYERWLRSAISAFFQAGLARGGDLLDTKRNVDAYLGIGMKGAANGDACLVALVDSKPVAFVMWVGAPEVLDSKSKIVNAIGSYTEPQYRNKTVATALRTAAINISRGRGYQVAQGPVHHTNTRGIYEFCVNYGAWPMSTNFELVL